MQDVLTMRSKLIKAGDPWSVDLSAYKIPLEVDEDRAERDTVNFLRRYAEKAEADEIQNQDTAVITCSSELPRFNRKSLPLRVGVGLFSKELEQQLIGWKKGQTGTVTVQGKPVSVTVQSIQREILPEITDELAARSGNPLLRNAADIRRWCRGNQFDDELEEAADEAFSYLMRTVAADSVFEKDPEEVQYARDLSLRQATITPEKAAEIGMPYEELREMIAQSGEPLIEMALLGMHAHPRTVADYEAWLPRYAPEGGTVDDAVRAAHPVLEYLLNNAAGDYMDELELLALFRLKEDLA